MRDDRSKRSQDKDESRAISRDRQEKNDGRNSFGWSKKKVPTSRSGRIIKGRGVFVRFSCNFLNNFPYLIKRNISYILAFSYTLTITFSQYNTSTLEASTKSYN